MKWLALAALLGGCLPEIPDRKPTHVIVPPPPPEDIRRIPHTFAISQITNRKASGLRMNVVNTGSVRTRGESVSTLKSYHAKINLDVPVFVVKHPKQGLILFGTGLSEDEARRPSRLLDAFLPYSFRYRQKKGRDIASQLLKGGIDPEAVRWVVLPNLGEENAGMADAFPRATVVVSRREWEWRSTPPKEGESPGPLHPAVLEKKIRLRLVDLSTAPAFGAFDNGVDFFGDGTSVLVPLPGYSPGNMGIWLNLDEGPALLLGGAAYVVDNYLDLALPVKEKVLDLEEYWRSLHVVRAMRKDVPRVAIFPGFEISTFALSGRGDITLGLK